MDDETHRKIAACKSLIEMIDKLRECGYELDKKLGVGAHGIIVSQLPRMLKIAGIKKK